MKARKVKGLDPAAPLADAAERIVRVRLDELCAFMPRAADPAEVVALHDMRIAAKRLRYILEVCGDAFGSYAKTATRMAKDLQDLLGEIHDCDVQIPEVEAFGERLVLADVTALVARAGDAPDLDPRLLARTPHRRDHAGVAALLVHLRARRELLFRRFLELWTDYERRGFRARLEFAITERSAPRPEAPEPAAAEPAPEPVPEPVAEPVPESVADPSADGSADGAGAPSADGAGTPAPAPPPA